MEKVGDILKREIPSSIGQPINHNHSGEPKYSCLSCKDAGYVYPLLPDGKPDYSRVVACKCRESELKAERNKRLLKHCDLPFGTTSWTLENYKTDKRWSALSEAKQAAIEFADNDGDAKWLVLMGRRDTGKSHLAIGICRRWIARGRPAKYVFVPLMLDYLRQGYRQEKRREQNEEWEELPYEKQLDILMKIDLLVLDDLGAQVPTPWAMEKLMMIIDYRYVNGLALVVTSNKAINNLAGDDERRIGSRLLRFLNSTVITIDSDEYRIWGG